VTSCLSIYHPAGRVGLGENVFGKDVANFELFQALARHGGLEQIDFLTHGETPAEAIAAGLAEDKPLATRITASHILNQEIPLRNGALLRGSHRLDELAWQRRRAVGDQGYSLMGLIHTLAPPGMRHDITMAGVAPTQIWDALICTSPSVQKAVSALYDDWDAYLAERYGLAKRRRPQLPLVPLGVNGETLQACADRPDVRAEMRARLGAGPKDVIVLWVGRLSFFEKAFPQPMMQAVQAAATRSGQRVHFAMVGWFPNGETGEALYRQAAQIHAPGIDFHILNGNDRDQLGQAWAAADIFLSLVDNVQETFGITPLEAMAAGLPVVVSDWDGYRYTVRNGEEGFLIPTLGGPEGALPNDLMAGHALGLTSYQKYVGAIAQHTAVHVGRAAEALTQLILSPDLRRTMGAAGRRRIATTFDWKVVAPLYSDLAKELGQIRKATQLDTQGSRRHPIKGDPFRDFAGFASETLTLETPLQLVGAVEPEALEKHLADDLSLFASGMRATPIECGEILGLLRSNGDQTVRSVLEAFPIHRRRRVQLTLMWLAKYGLIEWLHDQTAP